jgi:hypothetical protein
MKTTTIRAVSALCMGLAQVPACLAADPPADHGADLKGSFHSFTHAVAEDSRAFGHTVAQKSTQAGHAIAEAARHVGADVKSGAHNVKSAVTHDGSGSKD